MAKTVFDIGEKFEHLTVIAELPKDARSNRIYLVRCSCGTEKSVPGRNLRPEVTVSCGCHQRATVLQRLLKHGDTSRKTRTAEYRCWAHIKDRCFNPNDRAFHNYGGRGITVCARWRDGYENFLADVGRRPSPKHSIDRYPDNDGNYEPDNVRWATKSEQQRNRRPFRARFESDGVAA